MATSRVSARSRTGEMQSMSGAIDVIETSKRTWSLPLPVQPWATVVAPNSRAAFTRCLVMTGRDRADTRGYLPSYRALALSAGMQYSFANSSRASATYASTAPQSRARWRMTSRSSPPWPTSTATATTSRPVCSPIHPMATEVSRPPEYARTTRSLLDMWVPSNCWVRGARGACKNEAGASFRGARRVRRGPARIVRPRPRLLRCGR